MQNSKNQYAAAQRIAGLSWDKEHGKPLPERVSMNRSEKPSNSRDFMCTMVALVPTISFTACAPISTLVAILPNAGLYSPLC